METTEAAAPTAENAKGPRIGIRIKKQAVRRFLKGKESQSAIADAMGLNQKSVSRWCNDEKLISPVKSETTRMQGQAAVARAGKGPQKGKAQKRYTDGFKRKAVARILAGETNSDVARDVGVSSNSLTAWVRTFGAEVEVTTEKRRATLADARVKSAEARAARAQGYESPGQRAGKAVTTSGISTNDFPGRTQAIIDDLTAQRDAIQVSIDAYTAALETM